MKSLTIDIVGASPLLMHADTLSNPLDPRTKFHKELTSKKKKTDEDHVAISRSEWAAAMHFRDGIGPCLPTMMIRACLIAGAKYNKLGMQFKKSTLSLDEVCRLEYDGPRDIDAMWEDGRFCDTRSVKVGTSRVMRSRPLFTSWGCSMNLLIDPEQIEVEQVVTALDLAGRLCGLGDFRPACGGMFGRFSATVE